MLPDADGAVAEGPAPTTPSGHSGEGDVSVEENNSSSQPLADCAKQDGEQPLTTGCVSLGGQVVSNGGQDSNGGGNAGDSNPGNATLPSAVAEPMSSGTSADVRLIPRDDSKMPVSPRRAKSMSADLGNCENTAPGEDAEGTAGTSTAVRVNRHGASIGRTAAPKAEVWEDQDGGRGSAAQLGQKVQSRPQKAAKPGEPGVKKLPAYPRQPPKVVTPPKPKVLENGVAKSSQQKIESIVAALAKREKEKRLAARRKEGAPKAKETALANRESAACDDGAAGQRCTQEHSENLPLKHAKSSPAALVEARRKGVTLPGAMSSDSDDDDDDGPSGPHSTRVVRATLSQRSRDRETPRSSMPRTAQANSHRGSTWTISTPLQDRNARTYTRRRRGVTLTSMEQEVAGAPQAQTLSPTRTVSDAFNMHFDSREDMSWQADEDRPHLAVDSPFGRPRRSSNPISDNSGISDYSGYDIRESVSDASSRPGSLGLGRFGGHATPQLATDAWGSGHFASNSTALHSEQANPQLRSGMQRVPSAARNWNQSISDGSTDLGSGGLAVDRLSAHGTGTSALSYQQLQVHHDILQSPKGRSPHGASPGNGDGHTGSDLTCSWGDDYGLEAGRPPAHRQRALEKMAYHPPRGRRSTNDFDGDDDSEYCASLSNSAFGDGRRRSIGGKILQVAVFAVAGVAALAFGGELIKATPIDEDDDRDERD
eukprot:evm.model.scf_1363.1 EVM.evm.TU.scf_1363.1   scf_1363:9389-11518(+)